ncbi:MAG: dockerin type I repeat-containing protein [Ruminococcus sp.]|nr:dockerin type I repeat-containing protein [Ruminococcus sp.]
MKAKRLVSAVLATAMAFSCAVSASANDSRVGEWLSYNIYHQNGLIIATKPYLVGDTNRDGKINVTDVTVLAAYLNGKKCLPGDYGFYAADTNLDGKRNITDLENIAAYVKGQKK